MHRLRFSWAIAAAIAFVPASAQQSFVNFETPHVHPLDMTPDGSRLLAVNTPDNRLEIFQPTSAGPVHVYDVPVGLDPVSVRVRNDTEAWVVNHLSDSISIIDLRRRNVIATLKTADEPCDVVFAGTPERAFVSCSAANQVQVFDPANLRGALQTIDIQGEDPRAMAVSKDGSQVYVAVFESGNSSTILGGGLVTNVGALPNVVNNPQGPYGGQNPPPNAGSGFSPPVNPALPTPLAVGLIVKKDASGKWLDDNGTDWSTMVSGNMAAASGRPIGWDLADNDVAIIDTSTLAVSYQRHLMNICMALAVNPASGEVTVIGTEATNEIRFEPQITGNFLRVQVARVQPSGPSALGIVDLNGHLTYSAPTIRQSERDKSIGDPRGIVWNAAGTRGYVTGMGSNNVIVIDDKGARAGVAPTIEVGEGPTGVVIDEAKGMLYVLDKFESALSVVDLASELETARIGFYDPSPPAIKQGRKHLYDTHKNSGLGQIACASCHVDARMDRLAWDLGDPSGTMKSIAGQNLGAGIPGLNVGFKDWHPMKGPMTTQTLQDIIGKEPFHWRGDRDGLEEFSGAFMGLQGDDVTLTSQEMQEFEDFLATIHFPPNPYRNFDNTLPKNLPLPGHFATGNKGLPKGAPMPNGDAQNGLALYRPPNTLDGPFACSTCHTLPTGMGSDSRWNGSGFVPMPTGPNGEKHHQLISQDGSTNVTIKTPHLRNAYEKVGFETTQQVSLAGFGFLHDGSVDSLARFITSPVFTISSDQQVADLIALMLSFSGSDLQLSPLAFLLEPPGTASLDAHAAVGAQTTLRDSANPDPIQNELINGMITLAQNGKVGLVVKGRQLGALRGYFYRGNDVWQSDRLAERWNSAQLRASASPASELTFTVVPSGSQVRIGVDRDLDGTFDRDELDGGFDPADPNSHP
jgi:YVTN family beta-propeller protein